MKRSSLYTRGIVGVGQPMWDKKVFELVGDPLLIVMKIRILLRKKFQTSFRHSKIIFSKKLCTTKSW